MAGRMEDLLMGSDSDSDADDGKVGDADVKVNVAVPAPIVPAPAAPNANNAGQQPSSSGTNNNASKSELTNRLKNLYSSSSSSPPKAIPPTMNVARTGGPSSSHNPNYVPPMVHNQHHHNAPATAPQQQHMQQQQPQTQQHHQQQQPPPPLVGVGRVPAPLPKSRTNSRTAPPNNRMAAVPNIPPSPMTASSVPARQPYHPRQQQQQQTQQTQQATASTSSQGVHRQQQQPNPLMQTSDHSAKSSNSSRSSGQTSSALVDKEKKEKERFLMFTRVLMKYLEQRDSEMHAKAKQEIKECYEKNKRGDAAYKSLTQSMKSRLRATVGETYWKKAHDYLDHFFKQKQQQHQGHSQHQSSHSQPLPPHHQQQQQQQPPLNHTGPPPTVRTSGQHPTSQPPQPSQQHMMPQQQKINMQQTATSAALTKQQADARKKEKAEIAKKKRNEQAKAKRAAAKKAKEAAALPTPGITLPSSTSASTGGVTGSTVLSGSASVSSIGSKKVPDSKKAPKKKPASRPSVTKKKKAEASYKFKDNVHHAFLIDAKSIPNILSKEHKMDLKLDEEQRILLYGDQRQREQVRAITDAASDVLLAGAVDETLTEAGIPPLPWRIPAVYEGWGDKNLLSVRAAWSKVRLPESELQQEEMEQRDAEKLHTTENEADLPTSSEVVVISSDPATSIPTKPIEQRSSTRLEDDTSNHVWHNETRAEQDPTLALLSEATEMYLKEAIEKAIGKARLRQNLDGIRLWHTLHSHHADPSSSNGKQPPACIRLGCDVRRQVALADGNAAKTYQRLEEAIERENNTFHFDPEDPEKMVLEATSMSDLSRKPPLKSAASDADAEAKRRFEVFAGKDMQEPPFGRVKKAKVILTDLSVEPVVNQTPAIRVRRRRLLGGW